MIDPFHSQPRPQPADLAVPGPDNLGITYSAGRLKLVTRNGGVFSTGNPGYVTMSSTTAGQVVRLPVTTDTHYFDDASAADSDIVGEEFGTTAGVSWSSNRPFFLYAVNFDNAASNLRFAISPNPALKTSPSSVNNISYRNNICMTPSDINMFFLTDTNVTSGNVYTNKPALLIGSFRMTKSPIDDWAVATLAVSDGIGQYQTGQFFIMPPGQMDAASGGFILNNTGTAPAFQNTAYKYQIDINGLVTFNIDINGDGGTDGAGAVETLVALPYRHSGDFTPTVFGVGQCIYAAGVSNIGFFAKFLSAFPRFAIMTIAGTYINNDQFVNGSRSIVINAQYKAF